MRIRNLGLLDAVLLLPAAFFLACVAIRELKLWPNGLGRFAAQVVGWYAARMWTLWVLLLVLPLVVLGSGCAMLLAGRGSGEPQDAQTKERSSPLLAETERPRGPAGYFLGATTAAAGVILTIVILHMLAN